VVRGAKGARIERAWGPRASDAVRCGCNGARALRNNRDTRPGQTESV